MTEAQRGQRVLLSFIACKGQTEKKTVLPELAFNASS